MNNSSSPVDGDAFYLSGDNILNNGKLDSISDIKNIPIFYMDKNFSTKLTDIFKTEEATDNYTYYIFFVNVFM